jgi:cytochrome d ubiquinol oxidase subunit I
MDKISAGRALTGDSLGFHLLLVMFGVGLPLLISALEFYGLKTKRPRAVALAHTWSRALVVLFIAGAVSGTIVSLQFDLVWPKFMAFIGKTVGVAFALEGTMFLIEALFLSVYMLSWKRVKGWHHWLIGLPVVIGSIGSAVFITSANAFMNAPAGFKLSAAGQPIDIHVAQEIFTKTTLYECLHSITAYFLCTALVLVAVYAWLYRKKRHAKDRRWMRKVILGLLTCSLVFAVALALTGDLSAKYLEKQEPYKLAAMEGLMSTQTHAPLVVGGIVSGNKINYGLKIPSLLSFLADNNVSGSVQGLDKTPVADRPSLIIHYFFDGMVGVDGFVVVVPALMLILNKYKKRWAWTSFNLLILVVCGGLAVVATEFGWLVTELGRQPYIIHGVMKVGDAMTSSSAVIQLGFIFPTLFVILLVLTALTLKKTMSHKELEEL